MQRGQAGVGTLQGAEDTGCLGVLTERKETAIAARVGDQLVGFVQRLGNVQRLLSAQAELLRADLLERAQVERQGRSFVHAFGDDLHHTCRTSCTHVGSGLLRDTLLQTAALVVAQVLGRPPLRDKGLSASVQLHLDGPVGHRDESSDAAVAVHHQTQRGRLHAAHRQHALITGLTAQQGE